MNHSRFVFLMCLAILPTGCHRRETPPPPSTITNGAPLNSTFAQWDETIWANETAARRHELAWTKRIDALRQADDPIAILAQWPLVSLAMPRPQGQAAIVDAALNIQRQEFNDADRLLLSRADWQRALTPFREAGWSLVQSEWRHEQFEPATAAQPARSRFDFDMHGEQARSTNRFILRGELFVTWTNRAEGPSMHSLAVSNLSLWERAGPPAFRRHVVVAPEPDRPGGLVNLHPLIVIDANADRHDDIVLPGVNKVLVNDGRAGLVLTNFVKAEHYYPMQEAGVMADFTGDGRLDYLGVSALGPMARLLILHRGEGSLPFPQPPQAAWPEQAANFERLQLRAASAVTAGDVDGDGDLDAFVAQYRPPYIEGNLPTPYYDANDGYPSFLLLNDGTGRFSVAPDQPALAAKNRRRTLAASLADWDADGDMDLICLNDFNGVELFENEDGTFVDRTDRLGNRHLFGMGLAVGDFNDDGALDLFAIGMDIPTVRRLEAMGLAPREWPERTARRTDMAHGNRLYLHREGRWEEPDWAGALARSGWSWGVGALDVQNGGREDFYIANGHVSGASAADYDSYYWTRDIYLKGTEGGEARQAYFQEALEGLNSGRTSWHGYQHNALFLDRGTNEYVNVAFLLDVAHEADSRAVVTADLNEDGRMDLLVTEALWQGTPNIMRHRLLIHLNQTASSNHWIGLRFPANSSPLGATVRLRAGGRVRAAQVVTGDSFQAQHPLLVHFGLGDQTDVEDIVIAWPQGTKTTLTNPSVDRYHVLAPPSD